VTFSATLDRTVQLYRANFSRLITISVVGGLPQLPFALALDPGTRKPPDLHISLTAAALGIAALLFATVTVGALTKIAIAIHDGAPIGAGEAFRAAVVRFPSLAAAGLLTVLATSLGMILLVVPGFYILLGLSLSCMVILGEGQGAWPALKRSWRLARDLRWRIFGLLVVWGLLQIVLSYALGGLLALFGLSGAVGRLGQHIASMIISPCYALSLVLTYFDARATKEGHDLEVEARRLAVEVPPGGPERQ
jgi:hypothetical protein